MPTWCSVPGCRSGKSGHKFPRDEDTRKKWLKAIRRETDIPHKDSIVCKNHFVQEDYTLVAKLPYPYNLALRTRLNHGAVPSVFSWNRNPQVENNKEIEKNETDTKGNDNQCNNEKSNEIDMSKLKAEEIQCEVDIDSFLHHDDVLEETDKIDKGVQCNLGDPCGCNSRRTRETIITRKKIYVIRKINK